VLLEPAPRLLARRAPMADHPLRLRLPAPNLAGRQGRAGRAGPRRPRRLGARADPRPRPAPGGLLVSRALRRGRWTIDDSHQPSAISYHLSVESRELV